MDNPIITELSDSSYTPILAPTDCTAYGWWMEDNTLEYYLSIDDPSPVDDAKAPANFPIDTRRWRPKGSVLLYAKAVSGTPNLITLITE